MEYFQCCGKSVGIIFKPMSYNSCELKALSGQSYCVILLQNEHMFLFTTNITHQKGYLDVPLFVALISYVIDNIFACVWLLFV